MKTKFLTKMTTVITTLIIGMFFFLPAAVIAKEKSVIVGFHQKHGPSEKALIREAKGRIKRSYRMISAMAVTVSEEGLEKIKKNRRVAYVEEDAIYMAVEPLIGDEYANSWGVEHIGADLAHASGNKGAGVKIAVIDTGIDYTHEDLDDNYRYGYDFVFRDDDPYDDNRYSHGTHIAGVIAAEDNGIGVIGVAPEAELYAVKVLDGAGFGLLSWIIEGIEWSIENGMDIINLSLQGPNFQSLHDICDSAYDAGIIVVAAGGNAYGRDVMYPAAYDSVIAVTGTDAYDMRAYFSPIGPEVELAAPGLDILSTVSGGGYDYLSGTSQAAPHVVGTAALLLSSPDLPDFNGDGVISNADVRGVLQDTAIDLGDSEPDDVYGFGLVNAASAALPDDISFTITRTAGSHADDAETVPLPEGSYEVTIMNNGLKKVKVDVFQGGTPLEYLSARYNFKGKRPQEVTFFIDVTGKDYDVTFTPRGKPGNSADIIIAAADPLPGDMSFTLASTFGHNAHDAKTVRLPGGSYGVTIQNNGLKKVKVDVFEGGTRLKYLSEKYNFKGNKPQEVTFFIDATGKEYDVTFTPRGKPGRSADILISEQ